MLGLVKFRLEKKKMCADQIQLSPTLDTTTAPIDPFESMGPLRLGDWVVATDERHTRSGRGRVVSQITFLHTPLLHVRLHDTIYNVPDMETRLRIERGGIWITADGRPFAENPLSESVLPIQRLVREGFFYRLHRC